MYLGIDLGTSSVKCVLMDESQKILASHTSPLSVSRPHDGWSEQNPADWITAIEQTLDSLKKSNAVGLSAVRGVGLSGHMHGATLIDESDEVIRPCMLWNDTRSHEQAHRLDTAESRNIAGNILFPGFTAPKVAWVAENEPEAFSRMAKILLPKDYVRLWLTGEHVAEMSDAAGTGWLDVGARCWSDDLLHAMGLEQFHMPWLVEGCEVSGVVQCLTEFLSISHGTKDTSPQDIPPIKLSLLMSIFSILPVLILSKTHAALSGSTTSVTGT
jgi:xylulokinase